MTTNNNQAVQLLTGYTKYFIFAKSSDKRVDDYSDTQIFTLNDRDVHILPLCNVIHYMEKGLFEASLIEWCRQFISKNTIFLDIGAHSGTYGITLSNNAKEVHCFEPQRLTYYALCGGVALSGKTNIYCHNVGLGSKEQVGKQKLKIISNDGGGSSLHYTENIIREEDVQIETLDKYQLRNIGFIKMDVEENELNVLLGANETLIANNFPTILFESNYRSKLLFEYLEALHYKIIPVFGCINMYLATIN